MTVENKKFHLCYCPRTECETDGFTFMCAADECPWCGAPLEHVKKSNIEVDY